MAKINNSDYGRWAKRKSTLYLVSFLARSVPTRAKARLLDRPPRGAPTYLERKISAAHKQLLERGLNHEDLG